MNEDKDIDIKNTHDVVIRAARAPFLADRIEQLEAQLQAATDERDRCEQELARLNSMLLVRSARSVKNLFRRK